VRILLVAVLAFGARTPGAVAEASVGWSGDPMLTTGR